MIITFIFHLKLRWIIILLTGRQQKPLVNTTSRPHIKAPVRNFRFVLVAAPCVDTSGTAYCRKDLV